MVRINKSAIPIFLIVALSLIWGSSFILTKHGLLSFSNLHLAAFRMVIASACLIPLTIRYRKLITKKTIGPILIMNFIGNGIPAIMFATAQKQVDSSIAGILNSLTPLFTLLMGLLFFNTKASRINVIGVFVAFAGTVGLFSENISSFFSGNNWYGLLIAVATLLYGYNSNNIKQNMKEVNSLAITSFTFCFIGPVAAIFLLFSDLSYVTSTENYQFNFLCIFLLAAVGSALASYGWNILLKNTTALAASSVTYFVPLIAIMWGVYDHEKISPVQLFSILVILIGVYLVNKKKRAVT